MWVLTGLVTLALLGMACAGVGGPPGDVGTTGLQGSPGDVGSTDGENWKKSANWLNEEVPPDLGILSNLGKLKLEANALSGCVRGGNVQHYAHGDGCPYGFISQESMQPITTSSPLPLATPTSGVWRYILRMNGYMVTNPDGTKRFVPDSPRGRKYHTFGDTLKSVEIPWIHPNLAP